MLCGGGDITPRTKRKAEALNGEANEIDWRREDGYFEQQARPLATRAKRNNRLGGRQGRGRGRGRTSRERDLSHPLDHNPPELSFFEVERQNIIAQNAIRMHHYQQDLANMFVSNGSQPFTTGNMGSMSSWSQQGGGPSMQMQLSLGPAPSFQLVPRDLAP